MGDSATELRRAIAAHPSWYHTLELGPDIRTPGWFDLAPVIEKMPWPELEGKRCLDVGPYDGHLAFEMERRGAAEVLAADIGDTASWDWPLRLRNQGPETLAAIAGTDPGAGFAIAKRALNSAVERVEISAYELDPKLIGEFDLVVCGSLMLHLRDPIRALEAIRSVCLPQGRFLSAEAISAGLTFLRPNEPAARFELGERMRWWTPNRAGHKAMLKAAGFEIERETKPYSIPYGAGHPATTGSDSRGLRARLAGRLLSRGQDGMLHAAVLASLAEIPAQ